MQFHGQRNDEQPNAHLYKTSLCKNFVENGHCKYENNCRFAHGEGELRQSSNMGQKKPYDRNNNYNKFNNNRDDNKPYNKDRFQHGNNQNSGMQHKFNNYGNNNQQMQSYPPNNFANQQNPGQLPNQYDLSKVNTEEVDEFGVPTNMSNVNMNMTNIYNMMTLNNKQGLAGQNPNEFGKGPGMNQGQNYNNNNQNSNYAYNPYNNNKFENREQKPYGGFQQQYNKNPMGGDRNYNSGKDSMNKNYGYNKPRQFENHNNKFNNENKGGYQGRNHDENNQGSLYKTSLCKFFQQGSCKFGNNCKFAHGDNEMDGDKPQQNMQQQFNSDVMKNLDNPDNFPMVGEQKEQMYQNQQEFVHTNMNNKQQEQESEEFPTIGGEYNANNMQNSN